MKICLTKENIVDQCDLFVKEDCQYRGTNVIYDDSVVDANACQSLCKERPNGFNCSYWVYESLHLTTYDVPRCTLYEDFNAATCDGIFGPEYPPHNNCD